MIIRENEIMFIVNDDHKSEQDTYDYVWDHNGERENYSKLGNDDHVIVNEVLYL